jgi:hypothetical protein
MSRVKNPSEKKRLTLARDHRTFALEGNKTFRSAWRQKKARANRQFRRASNIALARSTEIDTAEATPSMTAKAMRSLKKVCVTSLAQSIFVKNDSTRLRWHIWNSPKTLEALIATIRSRAKK